MGIDSKLPKKTQRRRQKKGVVPDWLIMKNELHGLFLLQCPQCGEFICVAKDVSGRGPIVCRFCRMKVFEILQGPDCITITRISPKEGHTAITLNTLARPELETVKKQHNIPKMYLKNFIDPASTNTLHIYDKAIRQSRLGNFGEFTWEKYFYDPPGDQLHERYLGHIENHATSIIQEILQVENLSTMSANKRRWVQQKVSLIEFLLSLRIRTTLARKKIQSEVKGFYEIGKTKTLKSGGNITLDGTRIDPNANPTEQLESIAKKMHNDFLFHTQIVLEQYFHYEFKVLLNNTSIPFITSDNPITLNGHVRIGGDDGQPGHSKYKYVILPARIYLPLSPRLCLLLYHPDQEQDHSWEREVPEREVERINDFTIFTADNYIFSSKDNLLSLIQEATKGDFSSLGEKYPERYLFYIDLVEDKNGNRDRLEI